MIHLSPSFVNKDTELYKIKDGNVVSNNYLLLFQNTESKTLTYELEIVDNPDIKITINELNIILLHCIKY